MILKFILVGLSYALAWLIALLDYKKEWSDETRRRRALIALMVLMGLSMVVSIVVIYLDERSSDELQTTMDRVAVAVGVSQPEKLADAVQELKRTATETQGRQQEMQATLAKVAETVGVSDRREIADAVASLRERATTSERALAEANQKLDVLSRQLSITDQQARPPTLSLLEARITKQGAAREVILRFSPSRNEMLGVLRFVIALPNNSQVRITDLWPVLTNFTSGDDSKKILPDGRAASLTYSLLTAGVPAIKLSLSGPSKIQISGEYISSPIVLNIE